MSDDLTNNWGVNYTLVPTCGAAMKKALMKLNRVEKGKYGENEFVEIVNRDLGGAFFVSKVTSSGSDANLFAVAQATQGSTARCLVGCGAFVAGDNGPLQSWSTSKFEIKATSPCGIMHSNDTELLEFARNNTVPLPYHLPGAMGITELRIYEKKCLMTIHNRCLIAQMAKEPYQAILLELVLASNGAVLSDHALLCLGKLCKHHGISIVVDEIMTGGRLGSLLYTRTKPREFVNEVSHITLGKWVCLGLTLISKKHRDMNYQIQSQMAYRGPSFRREDCGGAILVWHHVASNQKNVQKRRKALIKK